MEVWRIAIGFLILNISLSACSYPEYIVEDRCKRGDETIVYNVSSQMGILRATSHPPYLSQKNCTIVLQPPNGKGVVLSVRKIDFRQPSFFCLDYLKIYHSDGPPVILCSFKFDMKESLSYYSKRRMEIVYHVESTRKDGLDIEEGFELIFTVVSEDLQDCLTEDSFLCNNGRCISASLTCDFRNNCGDRSDENHLLCDSSGDHFFRVTNIMYASLICLLVLLLILSGAMLMRHKVHRVSRPEQPSVSPYQAVHPCGYFICRNPAGPSQSLKCDEGFSNPCYPNVVQDPPPPYTPAGH